MNTEERSILVKMYKARENVDFANLYTNINKTHPKRLSKEFLNKMKKYGKKLQKHLKLERDNNFSAAGLRVMKRYAVYNESPQDIYMRVASLFDNPKDIINMYNLLSTQEVSLASPVIFNYGSRNQQVASCFLSTSSDSIPSIYETLTTCAECAQRGGGISVNINNLRSSGSIIKSTGGKSKGGSSFMNMFTELANVINQGGRRKTNISMYVEAWNKDSLVVLNNLDPHKELNHHTELLKCGLMIPDCFLEALKENKFIYLFSPCDTPKLISLYGKSFTKEYNKYIGLALNKTITNFTKIKASTYFKKVFVLICKTGNPYLLSKGNINRKCSLSKYMTICSSNLCAEVLIPSCGKTTISHDKNGHLLDTKAIKPAETGVCVLGAICLKNYVSKKLKNNSNTVDYFKILKNVNILTKYLDKCIDVNNYPSKCGKYSTLKHRPIGIGIMGLADLFMSLGLSYGSKEALEIDMAISATIYYSAMCASVELAKQNGKFESFDSTTLSDGYIQPDLWIKENKQIPFWNNTIKKISGLGPVFTKNWQEDIERITNKVVTSKMWNELRQDIKIYGIRNSYVTSYMPTASTSIIANQIESFEPIPANIIVRENMDGIYYQKTKKFSKKDTKSILEHNGSVQHLDLTDKEKRIYRTSTEIDPRELIMHAAVRAAFVSQSMSLNHYFNNITTQNIYDIMIYGWELGLKTMSYYIRNKPSTTVMKTAHKGSSAKYYQQVFQECEDCSL